MQGKKCFISMVFLRAPSNYPCNKNTSVNASVSQNRQQKTAQRHRHSKTLRSVQRNSGARTVCAAAHQYMLPI